MNYQSILLERDQSGASMPFDYRHRDWYGARQDVPDLRRIIHQGPLGTLEHYSISAENATLSGYSPDHQLVIPVFGAMTWAVGKNVSHVDANTGLLIRSGEEFSETNPICGVGHSALIVTFSEDFLDQLQSRCLGNRNEMFAVDTRPASSHAQLLAHILVCKGGLLSPLEIEERVVELTREFGAGRYPLRQAGAKKTIDRVKEILIELDCEPLSLSDVAAQLGVSPIYLTQAFKKAEGVPLYRYQSRLRMSRALAELPFTESITDLALELGYSSHSHFASAFRTTFGLTPSAYREAMRSGSGVFPGPSW
jgi:AraC family transcriptional regulator